MFIHSELCDSIKKCYEIRVVTEPLFSAIEPLLHSYRSTFIIQ